MTAIEHLVDRAYPGKASLISSKKTFDSFSKKVRDLVRAEGLPVEMLDKVAELNRATFLSKIERYIASRHIATHDFAPGAIKATIQARNQVVHRGIYFDEGTEKWSDIWNQIRVAREFVTRALLGLLRFEGQYFSVLHGGSPLDFPACLPSGTSSLRSTVGRAHVAKEDA
jgi:hypothetical protein